MEQTQKLTKSQASLLRSIKIRHNMALNAEMSQALMDIAEESGILEDVKSGKADIQVTPDLGSIVIIRADEPAEDEKKTE